jgi:hypothetical protein
MISCKIDSVLVKAQPTKLPSQAYTVYPNPENDILYIDEIKGAIDFTINCVNGQKVIKAKIAHPVDVRKLSSGIYFLKIGTNKPVKFVKTK